MYEQICRLILEQGVRLVYATNRSVGETLKKLEAEYPFCDTQVSLNEKIAYELALTGSWVSKRTACIFSTVGLYDALDPVMSSAYTGVEGGFVIVCVRETEEEVTPVGPFSKLPLIVADDRGDFARALSYGYEISEKYHIPLILQVSPEGKWDSDVQNSEPRAQNSTFRKEPGRWAATPKFRYQLHKVLNEKVEQIRRDFESYEGNVIEKKGATGLIMGRRSDQEFYDDDASTLRLGTVHPLPREAVKGFVNEMDEVYVAEGAYPVIELQIEDRRKVRVEDFRGMGRKRRHAESMYGFTVVRDWLGPSSSLNMAHGMKKMEPDKKILAITFETFFLHSGMPALVNTLYNASSCVILILVRDKEDEIRRLMAGFGFRNCFSIGSAGEIARFRDSSELTVLFFRGMI
jgi:TPP-dependent indolepyruvate ferredoxin oxidoreductase alpha subunit